MDGRPDTAGTGRTWPSRKGVEVAWPRLARMSSHAPRITSALAPHGTPSGGPRPARPRIPEFRYRRRMAGRIRPSTAGGSRACLRSGGSGSTHPFRESAKVFLV